MTNQNSITAPKVVKPTNKKKHYYKTLGTSVINNPMSKGREETLDCKLYCPLKFINHNLSFVRLKTLVSLIKLGCANHHCPNISTNDLNLKRGLERNLILEA